MISLEHVVEYWLQWVCRPKIANAEHQQRFESLRHRYADLVRLLAPPSTGPEEHALGYDWHQWTDEIRDAMAAGVPANFLRIPTIAKTMVFARRRGIALTRERLAIVVDVLGSDLAAKLLREDGIGRPTVTDRHYLTSANRCHHACHLAHYFQETGQHFWNTQTVIEWGGGYGNMARLLRRMNPDLTYVIIDLPEVSALQYIYLASLEGEDQVRVLPSDKSALAIEPGRIHLLPSHRASDLAGALKADRFISTWALTESPAHFQTAVSDMAFFNAEGILIAAARDANNLLQGWAETASVRRVPVPFLTGGAPNDYWIR